MKIVVILSCFRLLSILYTSQKILHDRAQGQGSEEGEVWRVRKAGAEYAFVNHRKVDRRNKELFTNIIIWGRRRQLHCGYNLRLGRFNCGDFNGSAHIFSTNNSLLFFFLFFMEFLVKFHSFAAMNRTK